MFNELTTKAYIATTETVRNGIQRFRKDQQGVTAIEYGLIAVAVSGLIIYAFYGDDSFLKQLTSKFSELAKVVGNSGTPGRP